MIDDGVGMLKTNLKMSVMEYGEAPGLGEFIYALIKDDKIRLID
jgi:Na+-translocating ferredoxin:NAD+ oxidoreductase RnfG subunit